MRLNFTTNLKHVYSNRYNIFCVCPIYNQSSNKIIEYMLNQKNIHWSLLLINNNSDTFVDDFNDAKTKYEQDNRIYFHENDETLTRADCLNIGRNICLSDKQFTHFTCLSDCNIYFQNFIS